ncbi:phosphotransferase [Rhizobium leguminosarum]|uniref:phosphotransferase n=1 Tax=Rhizobium leguminosarum TaxID=384 RepID=UPI00140FA72C|nr:phosphotransferase [Rhizobium leguminosarum]QIO61581.1 phosphotransferase [Rhizobium leguminosarum bv. trifolii]
MKRKFRVLLIEDDRERRARFISVWKAAFSAANVEVDIQFEENFENIDELMKKRPHVAIFDNVFEETSVTRGKARDNLGIEQLSRLKPYHTDTVFALYTEATFSIDQLGVRLPNPDMLITKTHLSNNEYQQYLGRNLSNQVKRLPFGNLGFLKPSVRPEFSTIEPELTSVIEQCIFGFLNNELNDEVIEIRLHKLTGGFSGSSVFRLEFFGSTRYENIPFVLKFSRKANVSNEATRYNSFVRLQLSHDMRVDLIGYGEAGDWAGACYAFAFGRADGVVTLTDRLREGDAGAVKNAVERIFASNTTGWYNTKMVDPQRLDEFFSNSQEYSLSKDDRRLGGLRSALSELATDEGVLSTVSTDTIRYGSFECGSLRRTLAKKGSGSIDLCFGHGDLNANNIFIDSSGKNLAMIDFEYAGLDHCYKDFVSLESSFRLEYRKGPFPVMTLLDLVAVEKALLADVVGAVEGEPDYVEPVRQLRKAAVARFGAPLGVNYFVALGLHSLKLLGVDADWRPDQKKALAAAALAAASSAES